MRVPAVVGSWPEPFVNGFRGADYEAGVACVTSGPICGTVAAKLREEGAEVRSSDDGGQEGVGTATATATDFSPSGEQAIQVVVGPWNKIRVLSRIHLLESPPDESGVFARFTGPGPTILTLLNERGEPAGTLGKGAGLVAALRPDDGPPTWVVTGTDAAGVEAAASTLGDSLRNHYAVAVDEAGPIGVPVP
jgi:hypothetical protein